ncbi:MAG TPA: c-type cytochrome biogenesis protein CcmI, partial [Brevundimonas sp.]|nr:c-type cytochrome biogenesis protein CcmI [Brevundimonas sp.]
LVSRPADRYWVLGGIGAAAAASLGLYAVFGAPGMKDQAYETRVREWASTPEALEPAQVAAVLGQVVKDRPDDRLALTMLGAARFEAGDPIGAASAFRRALADLGAAGRAVGVVSGHNYSSGDDVRLTVYAPAGSGQRSLSQRSPNQVSTRR